MKRFDGAWLAIVFVCHAFLATGAQSKELFVRGGKWGKVLENESVGYLPWSFTQEARERVLQSASCTSPPGANTNTCTPGIDCYYCPFANCWQRENATPDGSDNANCNSLQPIAEDCPDLQDPNPVACPDGVSITWQPPSFQVQQDKEFDISAKLTLGSLASQLVNASCNTPQGGKGLIPHANVHGCVKGETTWWCSELVPAYQPETVVTSPTSCFDTVTQSMDMTFKMTIGTSSGAPPNEWTLYAHVYFYVKDDLGVISKHHMTVGNTFLVAGRELIPSDAHLKVVYSVTGITIVFCVGTLVGVLWKRTHWVIVASSFEMCVLMCIGGVIGAVSVFGFIPDGLTDAQCQMRIWLLPIGLDLLVVPLCLKTWRVNLLFSSNMRKVKITNHFLRLCVAGVLAGEIIYNLIWTFTNPLYAGVSFSKLDTNAFEYDCVSDKPTLQTMFTVLSVVIHLIPCMILLWFAYRVRLSFQYAAYNKKHAEFDESLFIMLSILNITVGGIFIIAFQYSISGNPGSQTVMRCFGIAWIALATISLMFLPKFIRIYQWDPKQKPPKMTQNGSSNAEELVELRKRSSFSAAENGSASTPTSTPIPTKSQTKSMDFIEGNTAADKDVAMI